MKCVCNSIRSLDGFFKLRNWKENTNKIAALLSQGWVSVPVVDNKANNISLIHSWFFACQPVCYCESYCNAKPTYKKVGSKRPTWFVWYKDLEIMRNFSWDQKPVFVPKTSFLFSLRLVVQHPSAPLHTCTYIYSTVYIWIYIIFMAASLFNTES